MKSLPPRIYLVGFMGCGKTHIGRYLARQTGHTFLDLDESIEESEGYSISEIFTHFGEKYFREKEREALHRTATLKKHLIACGGGAPCFFDNADWINAHGLAVFLDIPVSILAGRLESEIDKRPLLQGLGPSGLESFIEERLSQRRAYYAKAALHCRGVEPDEVQNAIYQWCAMSASFAGIDFGSKLAGTTAIAYYSPEVGSIQFMRSGKGEDADEFLLRHFSENPWKTAFIDAPLSLPQVYKSIVKEGDYFLRQADRLTQAMSPMFLGGLTARAMRLKSVFLQREVKSIEVYPGKLARVLGLDARGYKQKSILPEVLADQIHAALPYPVSWENVPDWHAFDALLAFTTGWRFMANIHQVFGDIEEGQIMV